ncbi:MAG TPA: SDR family oxidoreductase [Polyangiaceae bacterium]|nr:SDR family oxidoreductase [Polyangiaceae bacterium]
MANLLIAGCGYVGTALGLELLAAGHRVWGLRRHPSQLPSGFAPIAADLSSSDLKSLPRGLDHVVYAASADEASDAAYVKAYVTGLQRLLDALSPPSLQRVFFISSTAVYGQMEGQWVDEDSETAPTYFSGVRLLEAERLLEASGFPFTILRCSGIYGPGRTRLIDSLRQGTATSSARFTNRIHRDDIVGAIVHLLSAAEAPARLLLSDDEPAPEHEVHGYLARLLGVPAPARSAEPSAGAQRGGLKRCRNARLKAIGYRLRYPTYREGYAALLAAPARG